MKTNKLKSITFIAALFLCAPFLNAQDFALSENEMTNMEPAPLMVKKTTSSPKKEVGKFAASAQIPIGNFFNTAGLGLRFAYNFTDLLRFTLDNDYYFIHRNSRRPGEIIDANLNLNFVFGKGDFHFYLLLGGGFVRYCEKKKNNDVPDTYNKYYYNDYRINLGCGIEYQFTNNIRGYFEPALTTSIENLFWYTGLSIVTTKLGASYCF